VAARRLGRPPANPTASGPPAARPFLKWAGGKRQLLPELRRFIPAHFSGYTEAFLGSGALFFDLAAAGRLDGVPVNLIDHNADLVGTYRALAHDPERVIESLRALAREHAARGSECYYEVRAQRFNPARAARPAAGDTPYGAELAAQFIYLNRTGFNGLFRLNRKGAFNVPVGRYEKPKICDEPALMRAAALLRQPNVFLTRDTFERVRETTERGTLIYFDPPYAPVSATAQFRSYTSEGFSAAHQSALQSVAIELARRGCSVIVSNSVAPQIAALYENNIEARRAGLRAWRVPARRAINSDAHARGPVAEYIVSNVPPA
jgi:DNA adenine methylase